MVNALLLSYLFTGVFVINEDISRWLDYKNNYKISFSDFTEEQNRFNIFIDNVKSIEEHNKLYYDGKVTWTQNITQFTHLTPHEFADMSCLRQSDEIDDQERTYIDINEEYIPISIDWTNKNKVTGVKNQGQCGSCWAFSDIGAVESQYAIKYNHLIEFSEQNLLDCASNVYNCWGCQGGDPYNAFRYIRDYGITYAKQYPYIGRKSNCRSRGGIKIRDYKMLPRNENAMKQVVGVIGPVAATLNAEVLQFYSSGIITPDRCPRNNNNHAILITGYGNQNNVPYWKIKNSWGSDWGERGYFRIVLGANTCGIRNYAAYPIM